MKIRNSVICVVGFLLSLVGFFALFKIFIITHAEFSSSRGLGEIVYLCGVLYAFLAYHYCTQNTQLSPLSKAGLSVLFFCIGAAVTFICVHVSIPVMEFGLALFFPGQQDDESMWFESVLLVGFLSASFACLIYSKLDTASKKT